MSSIISRLSALGYEMIFRVLARRRPPRPRPIELGPGSRILCFTCAGIGDTLTDSVVFKALRETFPEAHLAGVVHRRRHLLLEHNPYVDQVFLFHKGPWAFWRLRKELRAAGPWDAILHLRGNDPEPRCLSYLLDPDVTVSVPNMTRLSFLCGHQVEQPDWDETHGVEQTLRIARYVGADTLEPHLVYAVSEEERARLEEILSHIVVGAKRQLVLQLGGKRHASWREEERARVEELQHCTVAGPKPRLVLQLGGGRRASWRDWPVERYAQLIRLCAHERNAEIFVLGGEDQKKRLRELNGFFDNERRPYHSLVNKLSLAESAALLASARALVSTDTGIMHLGFAVGIRVVAIIHCNNPSSRVGPYFYGGRHRVVQLRRPAHYQTPADASMADIAAQTIFQRLKELGF